ncbi:hypothetical protein NL676_034820 [Syzygium grande]|nr:hypothetical protein NL676_034820 [Syzygium grande]
MVADGCDSWQSAIGTAAVGIERAAGRRGKGKLLFSEGCHDNAGTASVVVRQKSFKKTRKNKFFPKTSSPKWLDHSKKLTWGNSCGTLGGLDSALHALLSSRII